MYALMPRFALRLLLPFVGLAAMVAMAEPLPEPGRAPIELIGEEIASTAERVRGESRQAAERARSSAAAMRWLITLPAASASGRRCLIDTCSGD